MMQQMHQRHTAAPGVGGGADLSLPMVSSGSSESDPDSKDHQRKVKKRVRRAFPAYSSAAGTLGANASPLSILLLGCCGGVLLFGCAVYIGVLLATTGPRSGRFGTDGGGGSHRDIHLDPTDPLHAKDRSVELPFNPRYRVSEAIPTVGDRSDRYAKLRMETDPLFPEDPIRSQAVIDGMKKMSFGNMPMAPAPVSHHSDQIDPPGSGDDVVNVEQLRTAPYDIYNCPDTPPPGYPYAWNVLRILENWPPDETEARPQIFQGLCVFDYDADHDKAMAYRAAELPFVVVNDPEVNKAVERWNSPGYLEKLMGDEPHRCEYSENNHFMYYVPVSKKRRKMGKVPEGWEAPTKMMRMPYREWLKKANQTDDSLLGPDMPHWYYRLIGCGLMGNDGSCDKGSSEYLYDELPFFQPKPSLYVVEPDEQKGIHCRFGMKGVIAGA